MNPAERDDNTYRCYKINILSVAYAFEKAHFCNECDEQDDKKRPMPERIIAIRMYG